MCERIEHVERVVRVVRIVRVEHDVGVVNLFMRSDNLFSLRGNHEEMLLIDWKSTNGFGKYSSEGFWSSTTPLSRGQKIDIMRYIHCLPTEVVLDKFRLVHAGYSDMP